MGGCPVCHKELPPSAPGPGRRRVYCSPGCGRRARYLAERERWAERFSNVEIAGPVANRAELLDLLRVAAAEGSVLAARLLLEEVGGPGHVGSDSEESRSSYK